VHSPFEEARALDGIAQCALRESETGTALWHLREALDIYRRIGAAEAQRVAEQVSEYDPPAAA
jgi:hypothetical protein